jgi:hypothetical protein
VVAACALAANQTRSSLKVDFEPFLIQTWRNTCLRKNWRCRHQHEKSLKDMAFSIPHSSIPMSLARLLRTLGAATEVSQAVRVSVAEMAQSLALIASNAATRQESTISARAFVTKSPIESWRRRTCRYQTLATRKSAQVTLLGSDMAGTVLGFRRTAAGRNDGTYAIRQSPDLPLLLRVLALRNYQMAAS